MATAVWQDTNTDWSDADNWTGGAGTGGAPANNDTVIIGSGSQNIDTGLATGLTGITLRVGSGYTGQIGSTSGYLDIDGSLADLDSRGDVYLTGVWTTIDINGMTSTPTAVQLKGSTSTDIGTLRVLGGSGLVDVGSSAVLDDLEVLTQRARVTVNSGVTSLDTVLVDGGTVSCGANVATSTEVRRGTLTMTDSATNALALVKGGAMRDTSSGTVTSLKVYAGVYDLRQLTASAKTITAATIWGGILDGRTALKQVTYTAGVVVNGGQFFPHPGATVTLS